MWIYCNIYFACIKTIFILTHFFPILYWYYFIVKNLLYTIIIFIYPFFLNLPQSNSLKKAPLPVPSSACQLLILSCTDEEYYEDLDGDSEGYCDKTKTMNQVSVICKHRDHISFGLFFICLYCEVSEYPYKCFKYFSV